MKIEEELLGRGRGEPREEEGGGRRGELTSSRIEAKKKQLFGNESEKNERSAMMAGSRCSDHRKLTLMARWMRAERR